MYAIIPDSSTTVLLIKYFQYEPPNATWWQGCSRLSRSNLLFDDKLSLGALGSPGAIHYLTAKLSHSQGEALPHGEALPLSGTIFTQGEALPVSETAKLRFSGTQGEALPQSQKSYFALYE